MPTDPSLLFAYGTLRRGSTAPMAQWLACNAHWEGTAQTRGLLYQLNGYPGFVPAGADAGIIGNFVQGDLFRLPDGRAGAAVLAQIDAYEECSDPFAAPQEYARIIVPVWLADEMLFAWTYAYRWSTTGRAIIANGDFLAE